MKITERIRQKSNIAAAAVLVILIILQSVYTVCTFNSRQTFHTDEMWSYGLANSFYRPYMFVQGGVSINDIKHTAPDTVGVWQDGSFFKNYLTVQEGQRFRYDSVVNNQRLDMHPPVYFSILHTICSFFPNRFSWSFALSINIAAICIEQIFLFLLAYELMRRRTAALAVCTVYGVSRSALVTFCFIRHYALLTAFCTMFTYFAVRLVKSGFDFKRRLAPVLAATLLAAFTQQLALIYIGGFTFCICLYLLIRRRIKPMLIFGLSMTAAAALYILLWPSAISASDICRSEHIYPYWAEVRLLFKYITKNTFGLIDPINIITPRMPIFIGILIFAAPVAALCFLARKEEWFERLAAAFKTHTRSIAHRAGICGILSLCIIGGCTALVLVCAKVSYAVRMGIMCIRYLMCIIPVFTAGVMYWADFVLRLVIRNKKAYAATGIAAALCVCVLSNVYGIKYFEYNPDILSNTEMKELFKGQSVAVSMSDTGLMQSYPEILMDADKAYFEKCTSFLKDRQWVDGVKDCDKFYVVVNSGHVIWEEDMRELAEKIDYIPDDATKERMIELNVQFCDDYMKLFEELGFVEKAEVYGISYNNDYSMAVFEITNKK